MAGEVEAKLKQLGLELPVIPKSSVPSLIENAKWVGNLVFVSGHGPQKSSGEMAFVGQVAKDASPEEGYEAAKYAL